jgi:hypothetical protein
MRGRSISILRCRGISLIIDYSSSVFGFLKEVGTQATIKTSFVVALVSALGGCAPEISSDHWCEMMGEKPKAERTASDAASFTFALRNGSETRRVTSPLGGHLSILGVLVAEIPGPDVDWDDAY